MYPRVHAVAIPVPGCRPIPDLQKDLVSLGLEGVEASNILDVIDGYLGEGYGIADRPLKGTLYYVDVHVTLTRILLTQLVNTHRILEVMHSIFTYMYIYTASTFPIR